MYFIKLLFLVLFTCVAHFQKVNCLPQAPTRELSSIQQAVQNINPELDKITQRLRNLKLETNKSLLKALTDVHESISNFGGTLLDAVNNLQATTNEIIIAANKTNLDITKCISELQAKLEQILKTTHIKIKRHSEDSKFQIGNFTEKANTVINEADTIEKNINKVIGYCIRQNNLLWQKDKLNNCLSSEIDLLNKVVDGLYGQVHIDCNGHNADNATKDQRSMLKWINTVQTEFLTCVSSSKEQSGTSQEPITVNNETSLFAQEQGDIKKFEDSDIIGQIQFSNINSNLNQTQLEFGNESFTLNQAKPSNSVYDSKQDEHPRNIMERIEKLEKLFEQLKQESQNQSGKDKQDRKTLLNQDQQEPPTGPNLKEEPPKSSKGNRRFLLYISF